MPAKVEGNCGDSTFDILVPLKSCSIIVIGISRASSDTVGITTAASTAGTKGHCRTWKTLADNGPKSLSDKQHLHFHFHVVQLALVCFDTS